MIGLSRKSFIGRFINSEYLDRLPCSIALSVDVFLKGASFIRVHDVKETKDAINIFKPTIVDLKNKVKKYFGTDGIRGRANSIKMNANLALKIGMASAKLF